MIHANIFPKIYSAQNNHKFPETLILNPYWPSNIVCSHHVPRGLEPIVSNMILSHSKQEYDNTTLPYLISYQAPVYLLLFFFILVELRNNIPGLFFC